MKTDFDDWLALLAAHGKGGSAVPVSDIPLAVRGAAWAMPLVLAGNWSSATLTGAIRIAPDAAAVLASFTISGGTYDSGTGKTTWTASLASGTGANSTGVLPADGDGDGAVYLPAAFTLNSELLMGFAFALAGKV